MHMYVTYSMIDNLTITNLMFVMKIRTDLSVQKNYIVFFSQQTMKLNLQSGNLLLGKNFRY